MFGRNMTATPPVFFSHFISQLLSILQYKIQKASKNVIVSIF